MSYKENVFAVEKASKSNWPRRVNESESVLEVSVRRPIENMDRGHPHPSGKDHAPDRPFQKRQ